jgi:hypothetical protein
MKKNNLMFIVILMALIAIVMVWVLKNSDSNITTPTTIDQTLNGNVIEIPQDTDVPLEGLNIAPDTIPAR